MINYSIYKKRRQNFAKHMKSDSIAMIESSPIKIRNNDSTYRYRQCSNFLYLTGYNEPDAVLLIYKNKKSSISHFFSKKPNDHDSIWTGELLDSEEISKTYKFDRCDYLDSLDHKLIENSWKIPLQYKIKGSNGKMILKDILNDYIPKKFVKGAKSGFAIPIDDLLRTNLKDWSEDILQTSTLMNDHLNFGYIKIL